MILGMYCGCLYLMLRLTSRIRGKSPFYFLKSYLFIYILERACVSWGGAEGGERIPSRLHTEHGAQQESGSHDPMIMT